MWSSWRRYRDIRFPIVSSHLFCFQGYPWEWHSLLCVWIHEGEPLPDDEGTIRSRGQTVPGECHQEHDVPGAPRPCLHAQARLLPPGHEAREPPVHRARPRKDRRLWPRAGNSLPASIHWLCQHTVVSGTWGPAQKVRLKYQKLKLNWRFFQHVLFGADWYLGRGLHNGGTLHVQVRI